MHAVAALAGSLALLHACSPFNTDDSGASDGGAAGADAASDAPPGSDANGPAPDGALDALAADAGPASCFSLINGVGPFAKQGNVSTGATGTTLHMAPSTTTSLTHTFTAPKAFTTSTVDLTVKMTFSGATTWGANYMDLLIQGYGTSADYGDNAVSSLELGTNGIELNVWSAANQYQSPSSGAFSPTLFSPASSTQETHLVVLTKWDPNGVVDIALGGIGAVHRQAKTTNASGAGSSFTLVIGGESNASIPTLDLLVKQVCVTLE